MVTPHPRPLVAAACVVLLGGCGLFGSNNHEAPDLAPPTAVTEPPGASPKGRPPDAANAGLGVNAYLWRGALDTLSFMPLASEDPFGGVIMTDWYQPPAPGGERFRATAYILGTQLRSDAIRVAIFRQIMQDGQWADAPVSKTTAADIENKVLARARQLRAEAANFGH